MSLSILFKQVTKVSSSPHTIPPHFRDLCRLFYGLYSHRFHSDPAEWMPPLASYKCTYVRAWVQVKYYYGLSVDSAEKSALSSYLASC